LKIELLVETLVLKINYFINIAQVSLKFGSIHNEQEYINLKSYDLGLLLKFVEDNFFHHRGNASLGN